MHRPSTRSQQLQSDSQRFADRIIRWQRIHGRHDLPWQRTRDPYRIWLSEIMLQQTQVSAVIPYYERFVQQFPDVLTLARASEDEVLRHWSGLGYYARARNLHRAAQRIVRDHAGEFPREPVAVESLPGVGRSTAAAICVFAYGDRRAILDGNVKRVLARRFGVDGYPGDKRVADQLWRFAERLLPASRIEAYTQGLMDLGFQVCTRRTPGCGACPVRNQCVARREGRVDTLPAPRPAKRVPQRRTTMLILSRHGEVLLERRPTPGVWGGLWCFPEVDENAVLLALLRYGADLHSLRRLHDVQHGFTHFHLTITPLLAKVSASVRAEEPGRLWLSHEDALGAAIPAPVRKILSLIARPRA